MRKVAHAADESVIGGHGCERARCPTGVRGWLYVRASPGHPDPRSPGGAEHPVDPAHMLPGFAGSRPDLTADDVRIGLEDLLELTLG